ncbi:MAG: hypothetical protein HQ472_02660 [Ignavibacteria bacterium]|nr:hypothetical protein [Ignavibacteria bacterium]
MKLTLPQLSDILQAVQLGKPLTEFNALYGSDLVRQVIEGDQALKKEIVAATIAELELQETSEKIAGLVLQRSKSVETKILRLSPWILSFGALIFISALVIILPTVSFEGVDVIRNAPNSLSLGSILSGQQNLSHLAILVAVVFTISLAMLALEKRSNA